LPGPSRYILGIPEEESVVKIDSALQHISSIQSKGLKKSAKGKVASSAAGSVSDSVELTGASSILSELETQLADIPSEDAGKVESIRQSIAEGRFQVDEEAVAEGMVQETIEQLSYRHNR
jgi:negative regulator of flagellin synthesis FlgM